LKVCSKCKIFKDLAEFPIRKDRPSGYRAECKLCQGKRNANWRLNNPEADLRKRKNRSIQDRLYRSCKWSAARRNIEFSITKEDIPTATHCPYLGIKFTNIIGESFQDYNPSVDRIDNSKGYIPGNIQLISVLANRMKSTATIENLLLFARGVIKQHDCER